MKPKCTLALVLFCISLFTITVNAAESKSWWTDVSVSPYASVIHDNLEGKGILGVGLDLGYAINHTVSIHVANLSQEQNDLWDGDPLIKKTSAIVRADLIRSSKERLVTYVLARGDYDWRAGDPGFGVGLGEELRFTKNLSVSADYSLVAQFNNNKFGQLRVGLNARF